MQDCFHLWFLCECNTSFGSFTFVALLISCCMNALPRQGSDATPRLWTDHLTIVIEFSRIENIQPASGAVTVHTKPTYKSHIIPDTQKVK